MNRFLNIVVIIFLFTGILFAQTAEQDSLKSTINKLFEYSKTENYSHVASLIAYDGNDQARYLLSSMNIQDAKEESKVKRIVKRIKAMLDISDSFSFGEISTKPDPKFKIIRIEVLFKSGDQELKTMFSFVQNSQKYLLTDLK